MEKGRGTDYDEAEKSALCELVLMNVMMTRNDSERLVKTFLLLIRPNLLEIKTETICVC